MIKTIKISNFKKIIRVCLFSFCATFCTLSIARPICDENCPTVKLAKWGYKNCAVLTAAGFFSYISAKFLNKCCGKVTKRVQKDFLKLLKELRAKKIDSKELRYIEEGDEGEMLEFKKRFRSFKLKLEALDVADTLSDAASSGAFWLAVFAGIFTCARFGYEQIAE